MPLTPYPRPLSEGLNQPLKGTLIFKQWLEVPWLLLLITEEFIDSLITGTSFFRKIVSNNRDNLLQENKGPKGKMVAVDNEAGQAILEERVNEVHLAKEDPEDLEEDPEKLLQETRPKWSKT